MSQRNCLAVIGSPVRHSKSPVLHRAAYGVLDLPWSYDAFEVKPDQLRRFLDTVGDNWRGLSVTMPLKREILPFLEELDAPGSTVEAANTVKFDGSKLRGFNTDVYGISAALRELDLAHRLTVGDQVVQILGSGATAASVLLALHGLGTRRVQIKSRGSERAKSLMALARSLGMELTIDGIDSAIFAVLPSLVISTLPGTARPDPKFLASLHTGVPLVEVAYDPWPTQLAKHWAKSGSVAHSGIRMLINQALAQVRIFVDGDPSLPLANEPAVLEAMREAVGVTIAVEE